MNARHTLLIVSIILIMALGIFLQGCTPKAVTPPASTPTPSPTPAAMLPLSWEKYPENKPWSDFTFKIVESQFAKFDQVTDMAIFCPKYATLGQSHRINVWGELISAISYFESAWKPTSRMQETTMGTDPVTGRPVYSEGLLQLSYQDIQWAKFCEFDWSKDKLLSPTDPKKTILDPYKNLSCGIQILGNQIAKRKAIVVSTGVYWAVIKKDGKYQRISSIANMVKKLPFCQ